MSHQSNINNLVAEQLHELAAQLGAVPQTQALNPCVETLMTNVRNELAVAALSVLGKIPAHVSQFVDCYFAATPAAQSTVNKGQLADFAVIEAQAIKINILEAFASCAPSGMLCMMTKTDKMACLISTIQCIISKLKIEDTPDAPSTPPAAPSNPNDPHVIFNPNTDNRGCQK